MNKSHTQGCSFVVAQAGSDCHVQSALRATCLDPMPFWCDKHGFNQEGLFVILRDFARLRFRFVSLGGAMDWITRGKPCLLDVEVSVQGLRGLAAGP